MITPLLVVAGVVFYTIYKKKPVAHITLPEFTITPTPPTGTNPAPDPPTVYIPPPPPTTQAPDYTAAEAKNLLGRTDLPRGMRNNNPGNIRRSNNAWIGKIPFPQSTDSAFEQFTHYKWGTRAMIRLIRNYIGQNHNTIRKIITRYAPPNENNTTNYVNFIVNNTGINPDATISANDYNSLQLIIIAMAKMENGRDAITPADFYVAWNLL
jgi:hypothetical protein